MKSRFLSRILCGLLCLCMLLGLLPAISLRSEAAGDVYASTASALKTEIGSLAAGKNRNGRVRLFAFTQSADGSTDMRNIKGKHYLVRNQNGTFYALNGAWTGTDGNLPTVKVTASDTTNFHYITSGISTTQAFTLTPSGKATNGMPTYYLQFNNGNYLAIGSQYTGTYTNLYHVKSSTAKYSVRFEHANNAGNFGIRNGAGTHGLRQNDDVSVYRWKDSSAGGDYTGNALYMYRLWSTTDLRAAIDEMKTYLDAPAHYKEAVYAEFLACMRESIDLFTKYNAVPTTLIDPYDYIQDTLDAQAAKLRAFASELYFTIEGLGQAATNADTRLYQLPSKRPDDNGDYKHSMSYIIKTRAGKIIIIDGGWEGNNEDGTYLFEYLQSITGKTNPHITAWFITHAHGDHHGAVATFANLYADKVTVDAFYHHYPTDEQIDKYFTACDATSTKQAVRRVPTMMKKLKNAQGGAVKEVKVNSIHSGLCNSSFDFDEVHIDILLDMNDIIYMADTITSKYNGTPESQGRTFSNKTLKELLADNLNESSIVFRATVMGKNILFTGDAGFVASRALNLYHTRNSNNSDTYYNIQSDYVQIAHHGYYGLPKDTYQLIHPSAALFPTPKWEWEQDARVPMAAQWFTDMGAVNFFSYKGPQIFKFAVNRSANAVSIPAALKPYVFDAQYYADNNADLKKAYGYDEEKLYWHFVNFGIEEGRCASPFFDVKFYMNHNGENFRYTMRGDYEKAFKHYISNYKGSQMKKLSMTFDPTAYAALYQTLADQGIDTSFELLQHYAEKNYPRGRIATTTYIDAYGAMHYNCNVTQAVTPTCSAEGRTVKVQCMDCKAILETATTLEKLPHDYVASVTAPSCTSAGYTTYTCKGCGDSYTDNETAALGHNEVIDAEVIPTCTTPGLTEGKHCSVCNEVLVAQTVLEAYGHNYETVVTAPDCLNEGFTTFTCAICGDHYTDDITEALGHSYEAVVTAPTCEAGGYTTYTCACGESYIADEVAATGHNYTATVTDPTCEAAGYTTYTCTCGDSYIADEVAASGHSYIATVTDPTCEAAGYTTYTCTCGDSYIADEIEASGHSYNDGIVTLAPTCTEEGTKTFTCGICNDTYTEAVAALGHSIELREKKEATCTENGYEAHYFCTTCEGTFFDEKGEFAAPWYYIEILAAGHSTELREKKAPTCTENGYDTHYYCTVCEGTFFDENGEFDAPWSYLFVAATGHNYVKETTAPTCEAAGYTTYTCTCGDSYTADEVAALGHSYTYTDNGENHTVGCANCDLSETTAHEYADGTCVCGAVEATEPEIEVLPALNVTPNISIGAEIQVMYTIMARSLTAYESFYLEVSKTVAGGDPIVTTYGLSDDMIKFEEVKSGSNVVAYRAIYTGIGAKNMGDEFTTTLYAITADGAIKCGVANTTSIKSYLMGKVEDTASSAVLKTLAVDMLNYGAAAQVNFNYDAENLVNTDLTEAQKALGTQVKAEATDMQAISGTGAAIAASVSVQNKVFMYLTVRYAASDASKVKFIIKDAEGKIIAELIPTALAGGKVFQASYDGVGAKQMREPITIEMQEDGVTVSQSLTWSVESYVAQTRTSSATSENLMNMVNALLIYGDSAAVYLA